MSSRPPPRAGIDSGVPGELDSGVSPDGLGALLSGRTMARNTALNLVGLTVPLVAAMATIPFLLRSMGTERFGFLTVSWVIIGYFGIFDLGIGRALTRALAERLGGQREEEIPSLTWSALLLMLVLGLVGALVLGALTPWLVTSAIKISAELQPEALTAFYLLAFSLPWVILTAGLRGVLEANHSFGLVNALRVPMGLFNYLGPLAVLPFSPQLAPVIATLVIGRIVFCFAHLVACIRVFPGLRRVPKLDPAVLRDLVRIGGWMTLSNVISPLMTHLDRFLIGAIISMTAVAYYVTPYEVVTKLLVMPTAVVAVLFPAVAATYALDRARTSRLFDRALRAVFLIMFPVTLVLVAFAGEALTLWLGSEFAPHSTPVLRWLAFGVFINSLAYVPAVSLHGIGRPDLPAKFHLAELPIYVAGIWVLAHTWGIEGIAIAWVVRVALDTGLLFWAAREFLPDIGADLWRTGRMVVLGVLAIALGTLDMQLPLKAAALGVILVCFGLYGWFRILDPAERAVFASFRTQ